MTTWQELVKQKRQQREDAIRKDWLVSAPPSEQLDVTELPNTSKLLTPFELEVTETRDVEVILNKLASGLWSSFDVTQAFYKRAVIAHQAVSF